MRLQGALMPDLKFYEFLGPCTAGEAAGLCDGRLAPQLDPNTEIHTISSLSGPCENAAVFIEDAKALGRADLSHASLAFADQDTVESAGGNVPFCVVDDPRLAFGQLARRLFRSRDATPDASSPLVHPAASIGGNVRIGAGACIGAKAVIGENTVIEASAVIGPGVEIGRDGHVGAAAVITHAIAGDRLCVAAGAVIGQAGFGFAKAARGAVRMPQFGRVMLGNDVEIGANSTIDRGALADTMIGDGVKIDNLVQIGHNVRIDDHCILVAQAGVSGSCVIEAGAVLGGQAGIADHIHIGKAAQIAAKAGIINDVGAGEKWAGYPAQPAGSFFRQIAVLRKLAREKRSGK